MILIQAKKLHNRDEVIVKASFNGESFTASICGDGNEVIQNGKKYIIFDLFLSNGGIIKGISHKFLN